MSPRHQSSTVLLWLVAVSVFVANTAFAQSTLISHSTRRDLLFDHSGKYLYIATSDGLIQRYNLTTASVDTSFNLGGSFGGMDISANDAYLLVARGAISATEGKVQKVDLSTGAITDTSYSLICCEGGGPGDVAIASNGKAFLTTGGFAPLRQIDLASGTITVRNDIGNVWSGQIQRSADGTRLYFAENGIDNGPVFTYTAATDSFSQSLETGEFMSHGSIAVSHDGKLLATRSENDRVAIDKADGFEYLRTFDGIDFGVAFDPTRDVLYATSNVRGQIIAYDTVSFAERTRWNIGEFLGLVPMEYLGTGNLVVSPNGKYLALATPAGIRLFAIPATLPQPTPVPITQSLTGRQGMVFNSDAQYLYVATVEGLVKRYNTTTSQVDKVYNLGGTLRGIDITADDSFLLVAQGYSGVARGMIHKVDLSSESITNITYPDARGQAGAYDVAIMANGHGLVSLQFDDGSLPPLIDINLATGSLSRRNDMPNRGNTNMPIHRSADRHRAYFLEPNDTLGGVFTYDTGSNQFSREAALWEDLALGTGAVNRDGSLLATRFRVVGLGDFVSIDRAADFGFVQSFTQYYSGLAFDSVRDLLYIIDIFEDQIVARDTHTFAEKFRLDIGSDIPGITQRFEVGSLVPSPDGRFLALALDITAAATNTGVKVIAVPNPLPTSTPAPIPPLIGPADLVFDHSGNYLYVTSADGFVHRFNLKTFQVDGAFELGGLLKGADIAPDDSFLLVANQAYGLSQGAFYKLDLKTGVKTNITYDRNGSETGAWDVAIASNGLALATTDVGATKLRQIDLAAGLTSIRTDFTVTNVFPGDSDWQTELHRSADGSKIALFDPNLSSRPIWIYDATKNSFGPERDTNAFLFGPTVAVNRDGSRLAIPSGHDTDLETVPDFASLHLFLQLDGGLAFDATKDVIYGIESTTDDLVGYNTNTFVQVLRVPTGQDFRNGIEQFGRGLLVAGTDGEHLAVSTGQNVIVFGGDPPPTPTPTATPTPSPTPVVTATPVITLTSAPAQITEGSSANFVISATPNTVRPVSVNYSFSGNARIGLDYFLGAVPLQGSIVIPVGQDSATISIVALDDFAKEKKETVSLTLSAGNGYSFGVTGKKNRPAKPPKASIAIINRRHP